MSTNDSSSMIEVAGLEKRYGPTHAVKGLSFTVSRGEVVGFLGPNGAGKSTTMKMLTGFLAPTAGTARVAGFSVADEPLEVRKRLGYLPESAPLYDDMMVAEFLEFVAELRGIAGDDRRKRMREVVERCGVASVLGKDIGALSKGYRQRVGLAQAILHDPDLLILDEPTSGLDPNQIVEIRELIKDLGREKTVILSTHILPEVQATCGRILIINDGRLVADDTPDALTETESGVVISVVLKSKTGAVLDRNRVKGLLSGVEGVRALDLHDAEGEGTLGFRIRAGSTHDPREGIFAAAVQHDLVLLDMHRERVSLEDTFRRLTKGGQSNSSKVNRARATSHEGAQREAVNA